MAGQPELPRGLEMVAGGGLSARGEALREEALLRFAERRPSRDDPGAEVDGEDEGYNACAAARMASRSGTSASS